MGSISFGGSWGGGSINPFSWGGGSFGVPVFGNNSSGAIAPGSGGGSAAPVNTAPDAAPWYVNLLGMGLDGWKTWLGYDLQQQQIKNGQVPSVGYDPKTGAPTGQTIYLPGVGSFSTGGIFVWVIIAAVAFLFLGRK